MEDFEIMSNDELQKKSAELGEEFLAKRQVMRDAWEEMLKLGEQYQEIEKILTKRGII